MSKLYHDVIYVLNELRGFYSLGVVTSTFRNIVLELLEDFGICKFFDVVVDGDETTPKPARALFLKPVRNSVSNQKKLYMLGAPTLI
jgi:FMN phosphatase YigB (HAD superfamily)